MSEDPPHLWQVVEDPFDQFGRILVIFLKNGRIPFTSGGGALTPLPSPGVWLSGLW